MRSTFWGERTIELLFHMTDLHGANTLLLQHRPLCEVALLALAHSRLTIYPKGLTRLALALWCVLAQLVDDTGQIGQQIRSDHTGATYRLLALLTGCAMQPCA